nr:hypothetical protein [Tanacetum cinerariifolium]
MLVVAYWLLYPHLTGHQIFNPFDVPIICRLRLSNGRCIFTARCTSPKILELAELYSKHDPVKVVSLAGRTIQDAEMFEQLVDHRHLSQTPDVGFPSFDR